MLVEYGNISSSVKYFLNRKISKNAKILEIGCNHGTFLNELFKLGYTNIIGIDINTKALNSGLKYYPDLEHKLIAYNGKNIPFEDGYFDVVLMFDVMEHIPQLKAYLSTQVKRVLHAKSGAFIFQTPNKFTNIPWEILQHRSFSFYKEYHVSLQSLNSLKHLLVGTGFKEIVIEKNNVVTPHNIAKVKLKIGSWAVPLLKLSEKMPLPLYPNFWGHCLKESH